jgi:hypothetical protein
VARKDCFCLSYSSALKMEATCSSETSVDFQLTIRRYIPEPQILQRAKCSPRLYGSVDLLITTKASSWKTPFSNVDASTALPAPLSAWRLARRQSNKTLRPNLWRSNSETIHSSPTRDSQTRPAAWNCRGY